MEKDLQPPVRVGTKIAHDTNDWLDKMSFRLGVSKSSLVSLAVENYRKETEAVKHLPDILLELEKQGVLKQR